jgi:hypothetical protein
MTDEVTSGPRFANGDLWQEGTKTVYSKADCSSDEWVVPEYAVESEPYQMLHNRRWRVNVGGAGYLLDCLFPSRNAAIIGRIEEEQAWANRFLSNIEELKALLETERE